MAFKFSKAGPCKCGWLERESADPEVPITFDEKLDEYNLTYVGSDGPHKMPLRYLSHRHVHVHRKADRRRRRPCRRR